MAAKPQLAALLGIGVVVGPPRWLANLRKAGFSEVGSLTGRDRVVFQPPLPRVRLVHRVALARDEHESLARVVEHADQAPVTAVLEQTGPAPGLREPPAGALESATIVADEPERVEVVADLASPGLLVLRDTWYPGWRARVDGAPADILRVDHAFRGVVLPAGQYRVVFEYAPSSVRVGPWLSGAGLVIALLPTVLGPGPRRFSGGRFVSDARPGNG